MTIHTPVSAAPKVDVLRTPSGVDLWLVRSPGLPIVVMEFASIGGARLDPDAPGAANLISGMLDEGAGPYDSERFHTALAERAIELNFDATRDEFRGSLRSLAEHREAAFELLRIAVSEPHFAPAELELVKAQVSAGLRRDLQSPEAICRRAFSEKAFPGHAYGRPVRGDLDSVAVLTSADLKELMPRLVRRAGLKVVLVADMTPDQAAAAVDSVFAGLSGEPAPVGRETISLSGLGETHVVDMDVPQTVLRYAAPGLMRHDPDFMAATVVNHILGGSAFTSRLFQEVREKRGLAYGVSSFLSPMAEAALHGGGTATKNERAAKSLAVMREEMAKLAEHGVTPEERDDAVRYLVGSYPLRFSTSARIASEYLQVALDGFGPDYVARRNDLVQAVTLEDMARVAKRLYGDGRQLVVAVGRPVGLG